MKTLIILSTCSTITPYSGAEVNLTFNHDLGSIQRLELRASRELGIEAGTEYLMMVKVMALGTDEDGTRTLWGEVQKARPTKGMWGGFDKGEA